MAEPSPDPARIAAAFVAADDAVLAERCRAEVAETRLGALRDAFEAAVMGWYEQLAMARRQNHDLQVANTALLQRARAAEAARDALHEAMHAPPDPER